jgi:hypothetical protein
MTKKKKTPIETAKATIASVKKEMEMPRLTESVRNDRGYQSALSAETPARSGKGSSASSKGSAQAAANRNLKVRYGSGAPRESHRPL